MAGLVDQYHYCGNRQALEVAEKMADYFRGRMAKLTADQIEHVLNTVGKAPNNEYGGMSEVMHNIYAITKKPEHLEFADLFDRHCVLDPLSDGQDNLNRLHANTHIPQVIGWARHNELVGNPQYAKAVNFFWSQVTRHHSYATGGNSKGEHFQAPDSEAHNLGNDTAETCNVYNMLKLSEHVFDWSPSVEVADYYELALYNQILGSFEPNTAMTTYFQTLKSGHFKVYGTPDTSFWCCNGTGIENPAKYGAAIYFHNSESLWVNLFIPSVVTWPEKRMVVKQETTFPQSNHTILSLSATQPTQLKIQLRIPAWSHDAEIKVNGVVQLVKAVPGSYVTLDRKWKNGDRIELSVPMALHLHRSADDPKTVAIMYGPLVLAGNMGRQGVPDKLNVEKQDTYFKLDDPVAPALTGNPDNLTSWIKPVAGQSLVFDMQVADNGQPIKLKPYYLYSNERYAVYWQLK
jgi:DUF1680 family protein